jgi:hypothetical protein
VPANTLAFWPTINIGADTITVALNGPGRLEPGELEFDFIFSDLPFVIDDVFLASSSLPGGVSTKSPSHTSSNAVWLGFNTSYDNRFVDLANQTTSQTVQLTLDDPKTVPEPGTLALLAGMGIAVVVVSRFKFSSRLH